MVRLHMYPADIRFDKFKTKRGPAMPAAADAAAKALKDDSDAMKICSERLPLKEDLQPQNTFYDLFLLGCSQRI